MLYQINRRSLLVGSALAGLGWHAEAAEPVRGGTMIMIVQPEPATLALYNTTAGNVPPIAAQVYEGLLNYDWDLKPVPSLAKAWDIAADGKTITFHLREGVLFHDGKPFTSADVQHTFMEVLKKVHPGGPVFLAELTSVETPDPLTAIFHLANPAPYLIKALSSRDAPILSKALFAGTNPMSNPTANKPIGTGPFKFVSWERGQSIRLDRNDKYWNPGLPYLNRILIRFIPDAATRSAALETGEVHLAAQNALSFPDLARLKDNRSLELTTKGYETAPAISMLELNSRRAPFDKKGVRQAIAYAIDRQFIADNVFYRYARPATGPLSSLLSRSGFYTADVRRYDVPDRLAIANKLLDDAGLPRKNGGMRFSAHIEVNPFGEQWVRQAEYIKQALAVIGIDIQLRSEDTPTWLRRVYTDYDYDINEPFVSNGLDPIIGLERLYTTSQIRKGITFVNNTFYSNPDLDALLSRARVELDTQKRAEMYKSAQKTLVEDCPLVWLNEVQFVTVTNRKLHDHTMGPWGINQAFDRAWLEK